MITFPTLTVFTPAYNRAHTLGRTYESLCRQTSMDFKWVIVDDGSSDGTGAMVKDWLEKDNGFVIEYYWKENGGMHSAHNVAYEHIDTELAVCIDSDDWMPDNGVEAIISKWKLYGEDRFAGMIGIDRYDDGGVVGTKFPEGLSECKTYDLQFKHGVVGDKTYVYRSEVIKKYLPYPIFPGEKFGTVNFLYQVIDHDYDMLCGNETFCIVEYQPDGLSVNTFNQIKQSPNTRMIECDHHMVYNKHFIVKYKKAMQFIACAILSGDRKFLRKARKKALVIFAALPGSMYYLYLKRKSMRSLSDITGKHTASK